MLAGEFHPRFAKILEGRRKLDAECGVLGGKTNYTLREDTAWIRKDTSWKGPAIVPELEKRWVEITGPAGDRKMMINALNSGAQVYMADLEDSQSPEWFSMVQAYQNIYDACHGQLSFEKKGSLNDPPKTYQVNVSPAKMVVRVRGIHMVEEHVVDEGGRPIPAPLFDIAMYMFHNSAVLLRNRTRPLLYQPKMQSFEEAVLIHDIIQQVEAHLKVPYGTTRVTALIETLPGILQAEEIGFGLGKYWAGLNCGRWDYIFSVLKHKGNDPSSVFPDRGLLTMQTPFMTSYMQRIVQVCHQRGVHAMGGMSAFIPTKDAERTAEVMKKVVADKEYELASGCDGAWVAHPGMVKTIQSVFERGLNGRPHQINPTQPVATEVSPQEYMDIPRDLTGPQHYTENGLRTNINVGVQYIASWLGGTGAVAIHGLMEDMATAEISRTQVWQWLKHAQIFTRRDGSTATLDMETFNELFDEEVRALRRQIEASGDPPKQKTEKLASLKRAGDVFKRLVTAPSVVPFVQDVANSALNEHVMKPVPLRRNFHAMKFAPHEIKQLQGSLPDITLDARLAILRGTNYNKKMAELRSDGIAPHGSFIGTPNGHSAKNVVEGGLGFTWPYIGGWELNARGLHLGQPMPDTLSVNFHEQGDLAVIINRFLEVADRVQCLEVIDALKKIDKLPAAEQEAAKLKLAQRNVDYLTQPMLADLEQGWGDPKKIFLAVVRCLQNGVNIMHIEDQYSLKRCGHLGGKGLDDLHSWLVIFKSANLAANLFKGVKLDGPNQNINFVARTDALCAEFIQYSHNMHNPSHPDHPFIDWQRGFTPDGRYMYLKKGVNPATGVKWGLEHSAVRCAEVVKAGLASHVWMETPGADTNEAKLFMEKVNEHLAPRGLFARGLYNHSPSFVWDVSFFIEAQDLAKKVAEYIETEIAPLLHNKEIALYRAEWMVREFLKDNGDRSRGDYVYKRDYISQILASGLDLVQGEPDWKATLAQQIEMLKELPPSLQGYKSHKEIQRIMDLGYEPMRLITNVIARQRLRNFKNKIADAGFEAHLCTLPLYPSDAHTASTLARGMTQVGIHDFVKMQRAARKYDDRTGKLSSFFHQKATGTGWEVALNSIVGTSNTNILAGSTEVADHAKEAQLKAQKTGPSTYRP